MRAIKLNTDNTVELLELEKVNGSVLQPLQAAVGGYIEIIDLDGVAGMVIDEEGKFKRPVVRNALAMSLLTYFRRPLFEGDFVAGDVVLVGHDDEGDTIGTPANVVAALVDLGLNVPETV